MRLAIFLLPILLVISACAADDPEPLPTLGSLPELTEPVALQAETEVVTETEVLTEEATPSPAETESVTEAIATTESAETEVIEAPSATPVPPTAIEDTSSPVPQVLNATATPNPNVIVIGTPILSTLTPAPADSGISTPVTPVLAADVVIEESQFQRQLNIEIGAVPAIEAAGVDFQADDQNGIQVRLTASGGEALVSGDVFFSFGVFNGIAQIEVSDITVGSGDPPEAYVSVALEELYPLVIETLDVLLAQSLGPNHDLETIEFTDTAMAIMLLVPQQ